MGDGGLQTLAEREPSCSFTDLSDDLVLLIFELVWSIKGVNL
jgi:hypothetical protein